MDTSSLPLDLPHTRHAPPAPPLPLPSVEPPQESPDAPPDAPPLLESPAPELPAPAPEATAPSAEAEALLYGMLIRQIRSRTKLTQIAFTRRYCIPLGTFRNWEQGRVKPDATARSYLALIAKAPEETAALIGD